MKKYTIIVIQDIKNIYLYWLKIKHLRSKIY